MNFVDFLKSNENARKIFGVRELKIIEKQLFGINLSQSEKNRLSREIRKKLVFIKEAHTFASEFELKKGAIIKEYIEEAKKTILQDPLFKKIKRIIWYGSTLENKATFNSDIDIAIEFFEINSKEATLFRKRIHGKVNQRIDIQAYNHLPQKIKSEIDLKGRVLYEKRGTKNVK
jgi:predicted nucleotidyltransferase